jgi:hypothetical protein
MTIPGFARRNLATLWLVIFAMLCLPRVATAQSTDPDHPAPLGPGVNRGNVDNSGRGHTFYFFAGPGRFDIDLAFKEMGMWGSPLRQVMNFDFYTDDNKLASHNAIVSQGDLARIHADGDFASRERLRLVVTAQKGVNRLGGYYEINVKGAVAFEGPTLGFGVQPIMSQPLVSGTPQPLVSGTPQSLVSGTPQPLVSGTPQPLVSGTAQRLVTTPRPLVTTTPRPAGSPAPLTADLTKVTCMGPRSEVATGQDIGALAARLTIVCTGGSSAAHIRYFAFRISDNPGVARLLATQAGHDVKSITILSDLADISGNSWGCGGANCRIIAYMYGQLR